MSAEVSHIAGRLGLVTDRLDRVRRSGKGYTARCPAHEDGSASLSVGEGSNGAILVHCFAGCSPADVLGAIGLSLGDLFPERLKPQTPEEKRAFDQAMRESRWKAALEVIPFEGLVLMAYGHKVRTGEAITDVDHERLQLAITRIDDARQELKRGR